MDRRGPIVWLIRVATLYLLLSVLWRSTQEIAEAVRHHLPALLLVYVLVSTYLVLSAFLADIALRRNGITFFRGGVFVVIAGCACSLAIGNSPGLFLSSVLVASLVALSVAFVSAAVSGPSATFISRAAVVLCCFAAGAAWQVGALPLIATVIVRH